MRLFPVLCALALFCSCSQNSQNYDNYSQLKTSASSQLGAVKNCDVLRKMGEPDTKIIYNGEKYAYQYSARHGTAMWGLIFEVNNLDYDLATFTFENNVLCGVEFLVYSHIDMLLKARETKSICANADWNDVLGGEWNESKYKYVEMVQKPEIDIRKIGEDEFMRKVAIGINKGTLFRLMGKPDYSYTDNGEEKWKYVVSPTIKQPVSFESTFFKVTDPGREYIIVLKDNVVSDRYVTKELRAEYRDTGGATPQLVRSVLTDAERTCVAH